MSKMIIMRGLPASGKSSEAKLIMEMHGNYVRINKDLLRTMLHFDKFNGRNEEMTRQAARMMAKAYLLDNMNVIIDDTNLNEGTLQSWKDLAREMDAKVEVRDLTDVQIEECVYRDSQREKSVGGNVIKNMALRAGIAGIPKMGYVLCDIDGTISDPTHRLHYVKRPEGEKKDWKGFFSEMHKDPVRMDVAKMLIDYYNRGYCIIFMSARPDDYREVTLNWLQEKALSFAWTLIMRQSGDKRPDTETKKQMLEQHFPDKSQIHMILDDRPSVIRLWREMGLPVTDVGHGEEF